MTAANYPRFVLHLTYSLALCDHVGDVGNLVGDLWTRLDMGTPPDDGDGFNLQAIVDQLGCAAGQYSKDFAALIDTPAATPRHERDLTLAEARSLIGCTILIQRGSAQILSTCLVVDNGDGEWPLLQRAEDHRHIYGRGDVGQNDGALRPHTRSYIVVSKPVKDPA